MHIFLNLSRNEVYNISLSDLQEIPNRRIEWNSSLAHREMCLLKGKTEAECQNFVRVFGRISATEFMMCGTNSYKPLCRKYVAREDVMDEGSGSNEINPVPARILEVGPDIEAQGQCPYSPQHNSSYVFAGGQLFSATVADFQSNDPLIYREPQRTDQFDLMQLNQPAFVRVVEYASHVLVFFREVAMEYMNLGKAVYSRVARVCRNDRGGPHRSAWTSFQKTRLNCSVPGEYPFYFDEIRKCLFVISSNSNTNLSSFYFPHRGHNRCHSRTLLSCRIQPIPRLRRLCSVHHVQQCDSRLGHLRICRLRHYGGVRQRSVQSATRLHLQLASRSRRRSAQTTARCLFDGQSNTSHDVGQLCQNPSADGRSSTGHVRAPTAHPRSTAPSPNLDRRRWSSESIGFCRQNQYPIG